MTQPLDWARVPNRALNNRRVIRNLNIWERMQADQGRVVVTRKDGDHLMYEAFPATLTSLLPIEDQIAALRNGSRPWQPVSVQAALGVPAIFRAASMTALTIGSLAMRALRKQVEMAPELRPQIIIRPDPNRTPRDFYRDTGWNIAGYGEAWWWVSSRDRDGLASTLYNVPDPREVRVEASDDPIRPHITWRNRSTRDGTLKREDMRQLTFLLDESGLRGVGPLQLCRAAATVSVEAQEWAANFYASGGYPSILIKSATSLGGGDDGWSTDEQAEAGVVSEAERLKAEWIATAPNTPKVIDPEIEDVKVLEVPMGAVQALDARNMQNGEAARMYGIPGVLLEFVQSGSSLTYQNVDRVFTQWVRTSLRPSFLEPIEQAMSDLLPRSTVARFDTETIEMPDVKTRYEVYEIGIRSGIITPQIAQAKEGYLPGDVENAPIPQPPARPLIPHVLSTEMREVRCPTCSRLVVRAAGPVEAWCRHCKAEVRELVVMEGTAIHGSEGMVQNGDARELMATAFAMMAAVAAREPAPAAQPTSIELHVPLDVHVTTTPTPISVEAPEVTVEAPTVNVEAPSVTVMPAELHSETPVNVTVVPSDVTVIQEPAKPKTKRIVRDEANQITEIIEEPTDG